MSRRYVDPEDIDNQMAMVAGLVDAATEGDAAAAKVVVGLLGEDAAEKGNTDQLSSLYDALEAPEEPEQ